MTKSIYDTLAVDYDSSTLRSPYFAHLNSRYREILTQNLPRLFATPLLDLGCGTGLFMNVISKWASHYVGIDLSRKMLGEAKTKSIEIEEAVHTSLLRADASHLPFKEDSIGGVVSVGMVLSHLQSYEKGLLEISRILRHGGRFLIELDNKWSVDLLHYLADALTAGRVFSYGFSNFRELSRYIQQDEYEWDASLDGVPAKQKMLLHKISFKKLKHTLETRCMRMEDAYGVHFATLFTPKEFPRDQDGVGSMYLGLVEWLDRRLSNSYPFAYLGGSLIIVGRKE